MSSVTYFTDSLFRAYAEQGRAIVEPFSDTAVQPASIDLRVGECRYDYLMDHYVLGDEIDDSRFAKETFERFVLQPGCTIFVGIEEVLSIPNDCVGFIFPRSSISRLGILIQPMYMNPGYSGRPPLSISNQTRVGIEIVPGRRVAQLLCAQLACSPDTPYDEISTSKYVGEDVAPSRIHTDEELKAVLKRALKEITRPKG